MEITESDTILFGKDEEISFLQRENATLKHYLYKAKQFLIDANKELYYFTSNKTKEKVEIFLRELENLDQL